MAKVLSKTQAIEQERKQDLEQAYVDWLERLEQAKEARSSWDDAFDICNRIMSNDIPTFSKTDEAGNDTGITGYMDVIVKNNPAIPGVQWKKSLIEKADVDLNLKPIDGIAQVFKPSLQNVINWMFDKFGIVRKSSAAVYECAAYGYGVQYLGWNQLNRTSQFKKGTPRHRHVHCRNYLVDPASDKYSGWANRRYEFERILMDLEEARLTFPEFADSIVETQPNEDYGDDTNMKDKAEIWLVQYKKLKRYLMEEVSYPMNIGDQIVNIERLVDPDEVEEVRRQRGARTPDEQIDDEVLDEITPTEPFEVEREEWFQFYMSKDAAAILTEPEHIGDIDHYSPMLGYLVGDGIYPVSNVYLTSGNTDAETILLNKALYDVVANGSKITMVEEGAIQNPDEFKNSINSLNPFAVIKSSYIKACRDAGIQPTPITFVDRKVEAQLSLVLSDLLQKTYDKMNNSTNTNRGVPDYSGQSGIQVSNLQNTSMIMNKTEELVYADFIKKLGEILLRFVVDFMDYEFTIPDINNTVSKVNEGNVVMWDYDGYYIEPIMQNDPTTVEQIMKQYYAQWAANGWMSPVDAMEAMGEDDAENIYKRSPHYANIGVVQEAMQKNPQLAQNIMAMIMGNSEGQPSENKQAVQTA